MSLPLPQGWTSAANQQGGYRMTTFSGPSVDVPERDGIQVQVMAGPAPTDQTLREVAGPVLYRRTDRAFGGTGPHRFAEEGFLWTFEWERPPAGRPPAPHREGGAPLRGLRYRRGAERPGLRADPGPHVRGVLHRVRRLLRRLRGPGVSISPCGIRRAGRAPTSSANPAKRSSSASAADRSRWIPTAPP